MKVVTERSNLPAVGLVEQENLGSTGTQQRGLWTKYSGPRKPSPLCCDLLEAQRTRGKGGFPKVGEHAGLGVLLRSSSPATWEHKPAHRKEQALSFLPELCSALGPAGEADK